MAGSVALQRFRANTDAISAVEFAIIFPVVIVLMLGGTQVVTYINAVRKVEAVASSISEQLSQLYDRSNPAATTYLATATDLHFAYDQTMVIFPYVMKDAARQGMSSWGQDITIDFASVNFTKLNNNCAGQYDQSACYVATVVWTTTGLPGTNFRPCGIQLPTTSSYPNNATLPSNIFGAGSVIAVDVVFNFTSAFGGRYFGSQRIARSVYVQPRYLSLLDFNIIGNDGIATRCP